MFLKVALSCFLALSISAFAQVGNPVSVDGNTIALWNFNNDPATTFDNVLDDAVNPINGTAYSAPLGPLPGLDVAFENGRQFSTSSSFIDLGVSLGTKLDLTGSTAFTIEAVIKRTGNAPGNHTIYENRQIQFLVIDNQLAAFVAQPGGFLGLVSTTLLSMNTNYRATMELNGGFLSLFLNGVNVGSVQINNPVASPINPTYHAFIGGSILGEFFPGYIDDVRLSDIARIDNLPPVVAMLAPIPGQIVTVARPNFNITFADDSNIDVGSIKVYLNDVLQTGISRNASGVQGQMDDDLISGNVNTIKIVVNDEFGNRAEKTFNIIRGAIGGRTEYTPDADTLGLWHMNENSAGFIADSSVRMNHGFNPTSQSTGTVVAEGIFGNGREFSSNGHFDVPPLRLPGQKFTFETWLRPNNNTTGSLINTDQVEVQRRTTGFIRILIRTRLQTFDYETLLNEFPAGEFHHLAVVWDGTKTASNLVVFKDGVLIQAFDAPNNCDFNPAPKIATIGSGFTGLLDEMRFSSVVRSSFNVPSLKEVGIFFLTLQNGTSVNTDHPQVNVNINSLIGINPQNISISLNGVSQTASTGLTITATNISGTMENALTPGMNEVEVQYIDNDNNQKKKKQYFFYIVDGGGTAYTADSDTAILLHFESPNGADIEDSSDGHYTFLPNSPTISQAIPGVIGFARRGSQLHSDGQIINLGTRSHTLEGFFKRRQDSAPYSSDFSIMRISRSGFSNNITLDPTTGKIGVTFSTSSSYMDEDVIGAVPVDDNYHHIAMVFDDSRDFAQYMIIVDGQVKFAKDYDCHCNFDGEMQVTIDDSARFEVDEVRISKVARYTFNYGIADRPDITSFTPAIEATLHTLTPPLSYALTDPSGISPTGTYLKINGVLQSGLNLDLSGFNGTLSGTASNMVAGTNDFELHVKNGLGYEEVRRFFVFVIMSGGATAYTTDVNTTALYHMDETSGSVLADDSGQSNDVNLTGSYNLNVPGVFSSTGLSLNDAQPGITIPDLIGLSNYTMEGFVKFANETSPMIVMKIGYLSLCGNYYAAGNLTVRLPSYETPIQILNPIHDSLFHHFGIIVDSSRRNVLLVIDGEVVGSGKVPTSALAILSDSLELVNYTGGQTLTMDEFRISKIPRYTLNYSQSKRKQQAIIGAE
ncbi:MAG: hypothetical protein HYV97_03750 [Bdellovibrio sp.]|nr:hypothetical protein [Bdellovibrio sp.]